MCVAMALALQHATELENTQFEECGYYEELALN